MNDKTKSIIIGLIAGILMGMILLYSLYWMNRELSLVCTDYDQKTESCLKTTSRDQLTLDTASKLYEK